MPPEYEPPAPPPDLGKHGTALWRAVVNGWSLRHDELVVLAHGCREEDLIHRMAAEQDAAELIVEGYNKQPVINGLVTELARHRALLASLLKQLRLPDEAGTAETLSEKARRAAHARWRSTPTA